LGGTEDQLEPIGLTFDNVGAFAWKESWQGIFRIEKGEEKHFTQLSSSLLSWRRSGARANEELG
jgi:hypothetical protein